MADKKVISRAPEGIFLLFRLAQEIWNQGREETIKEVFDPNAVLHFPTGIVIGQSGYKAYYQDFRRSFSGISMALEDGISRRDRLAARWCMHMCHTGEYQGIPPTARYVELSGITVGRIRDGRIYEAWDQWNLIGLLAQLQVLPDEMKIFAGIPR